MDQSKVFYMRLQAVCSGKAQGQLFIVGIVHRYPDPVSDPRSVVLDAQITDKGLVWKVLLDGAQIFTDHYSHFNCMVRDQQGTLYVGEDDGLVSYQEGGGTVIDLWKQVEGSMECAYARGGTQVVFGSTNGWIVHFDKGTLISKVQVGHENQRNNFLTAIHGVGADFMVTVGWKGIVARYSADQWVKVAAPSNVDLRAVWCCSETEIYIGGQAGLAWRWDGDGRWQPLAIDTSKDPKVVFTGFAHFQGTLYAVCGGNLYRLEGHTFVPLPKVCEDQQIGELAVTTSGLIGLGCSWGQRGNWFTRFDGKTWTAEQINIKLP